MKTKTRGQVSVEYMIVLGFATFAITGIIGLAFYYMNTTNDTMSSNHIKNFADTIISNSESVYFAGYPSKITISPYLPKGVKKVEVKEDGTRYEIVITFQTSSGENVIGFISKAPLVEKVLLDNQGIDKANEGVKNIIIQYDSPINPQKIDISLES